MICSASLSGLILSFTWAFCRTSIICSRWCSEVINRSTIEICVGIFFSCSATFYSGFLRALFRPSHISYLSTFFTLFLLHFFNAIVLLSYVQDTFEALPSLTYRKGCGWDNDRWKFRDSNGGWCGPWLMVDMDWDRLVEHEFIVLYLSVVWLEGIWEVFTELAQAYFYGVCLSLNWISVRVVG